MKLRNYLPLLVILLFASCDEDGEHFPAKRIVKNFSGVDVKIEAYRTPIFTGNLGEFTLASGETKEYEGTCVFNGIDEGCIVGWDDLITRSGAVTFNNERVQLFSIENTDTAGYKIGTDQRTVLKLGDYDVKTIDGVITYTIEIDTTMYNKAIPLDSLRK